MTIDLDQLRRRVGQLPARMVTAASRMVVKQLAEVTPYPGMIRLGSSYGGWWVPGDLFGPDSICYLAGVGEDITFDLAMIKLFECHVWALDPTPRSIAYVANVDEPRFHFIPVGLWSEDTTRKFFEPADPTHVSHSVTNMQRTTGGFDAECVSLSSLMIQRGHARIDLLKLDIEGAEVAVLEAMLAGQVRPRVLCVEFDELEPPWRTLHRIRALAATGYRIRHREGHNYTLIRD